MDEVNNPNPDWIDILFTAEHRNGRLQCLGGKYVANYAPCKCSAFRWLSLNYPFLPGVTANGSTILCAQDCVKCDNGFQAKSKMSNGDRRRLS
ncbi:hypothetical protein ZHAS_00004729 [Anopheles sinensis]|uniref:Uncharacterized protein n=1 Tax=Anopheles sinensis TaxID=74873 RepID=A0A084VHN3_ANOSI|nr:hypothetical protein ZHAS_00004729 [Anopheles sinensis]